MLITCTAESRCRRWRTCPKCAAIRQARIASAAAHLESLAGRLDWATLSPIRAGETALLEARREFLEAVKPAGAVWTVEQSPDTKNLHCNILLPSHEPRRLRLSACHVIRGIDDARRVGAYISKREQMPSKGDYHGRLFGTAGPLWQHLSRAQSAPVVQAAALQYDIDPLPIGESSDLQRRACAENRELSWPEYREIAARHMPDILSAVGVRPDEMNRPRGQVDSSLPLMRHRHHVRPGRFWRWITGQLHPHEKDWSPRIRSK